MITEKEYRYWLCNIPGFGARKIAGMIRLFGSAEAVWKSSEESIAEMMRSMECRNFKTSDVEQICKFKSSLEQAVQSYHKLEEKGIRFITPQDPLYPERLKTLYDMPQGLYVKGRIPETKRAAAAIVGARSCSHYGKEIAFLLAKELCSRGVDIISGMALGIDGEAHRGALAAESQMRDSGKPMHAGNSDSGSTYAVLGCGADVCYPRTNYDIYRQADGIISEFAPGTQPMAPNFPMRNRIISGLADIVIVVEARFRSGSLITADQALEQGRDVYVIPGRVTDPLSRGCNELIRQGAGIITDPVEFVENLFPPQCKIVSNCKKNEITLALSEEKVYSCLDFNPTHLGTIVNLTGLSTQETVSILMQLVMKELVTETSKNYYALKFR